MEATGKIIAKAGTGKSFKLDDGNWYNVAKQVEPYLAKANKGDEVTVEYEKKGNSSIVTKLMKGAQASRQDDTPAQEQPKASSYQKKAYNGGGSYQGDDKRAAQIQRGNALNAAAASLSTMEAVDVETKAQMVLTAAEMYLEWLRAE